MKVTFLGATHEVTGSCTLIEIGTHHILIDCGMEQGANIFENQSIPVKPSEIDCVILTHAHIDHSGNIPILFKGGYSGPVYATEATCNLCKIMLMDSAHIQEQEAEWKNRKALRAGKPPVLPIYDSSDAEKALKKFIPCKYNQKRAILENVVISFTDIGHLLGSAAVEIMLEENGEKRKIVFSGDVGNKKQPILRDPSTVKETDYLVIESTYGNRVHSKERVDYISELASIIQSTFDKGGNLIIPSFAVGRTQEILFFLRQIKQDNLIKGHPHFPVYIDSPLATEATGIFMQTSTDFFDAETKALIDSGVNPIYFDDLIFSESAEDSKAINFDNRPKIIISASGMCEAGRIRHHLKHNLWREESTVLFVGYQAEGTLGRALVDSEDEVVIFGETVQVNAEIKVLAGVSGHADKDGLLEWLNGFSKKPKKVFVNHGDDDACNAFVDLISSEYGYSAYAPFSGTTFDMITGELSFEAQGVKINANTKNKGVELKAYDRLKYAIDLLSKTAQRMQYHANKDIARFTTQINNLNSKWSTWLDS